MIICCARAGLVAKTVSSGMATSSRRAASAQLDPDRRFFLDLDKLDDGRAREHRSLPSNRWTLEAAAWLSTLIAFVESL